MALSSLSWKLISWGILGGALRAGCASIIPSCSFPSNLLDGSASADPTRNALDTYRTSDNEVRRSAMKVGIEDAGLAIQCWRRVEDD
ncbi:hypothetical protein DFH06DRAFT_275541 [Mycena polygramma]|nr:hypothetical protein DFH06DRAFT_275541 [Mycena polygramma]